MLFPDMGYVAFVVWVKFKLFDKRRKIKYNALYKQLQLKQYSNIFQQLEYEMLDTDPKTYFRMFSYFRLEKISIYDPDWESFHRNESLINDIAEIFEDEFQYLISKGHIQQLIANKETIMQMYYDRNLSLGTIMILYDLFGTRYFEHIDLCLLGYQPIIDRFNWRNRIKLMVTT